MAGISSSLYRRLQDTLLKCEVFDSDQALRDIFVDDRIAPWKEDIPQARTRRERVRETIYVLHDKSLGAENALALFLYVVRDGYDPADARYKELDDLAATIKTTRLHLLSPTAMDIEQSGFWLALLCLALAFVFNLTGLNVFVLVFGVLAAILGIVGLHFVIYPAIHTHWISTVRAASGGAVAAGAVYLMILSMQPSFEVAALNTLVDDHNAYELTDMLIWNRNTAEDEQYGVDIAFPIEIRPRYYGSQRLGRVLAIISGDGTASKEIVLWDDFTRDASTQRVTLTLAELVTISGLHDNSDPGIHRLNLENHYFEQATVRIQITREAQKSRPWHSETITVRNAPWQEDTVLVTRHGRREVDVYIKNWGGTGDFTVRYRLARHDDIVPYGTTIKAGNEPTTLVNLRSGESFTLTIPLPDDLGYGRYSVEVYAVKKQNYVWFTNAQATWSSLSSLNAPWWFGGSPTQEHYFAVYTEPRIDDVVKAERERLHNDMGFDLGIAQGPAENVISYQGTEGKRQIFESGEVYVHSGQAYALYGSILEHYLRLEGFKHRLIGFPISIMQTVTSALGTQATMMVFEGGEGWPSRFYASQQTTAVVWGSIAQTYLSTYGGPEGWLGLPLSDECYHADSTVQKYEGGYMVMYYPVVDGERDHRTPLAYPYLTRQGIIQDVYAEREWQNTGLEIKPDDVVRIIQVGGAWTHWESGTLYDANGYTQLGLQANTPLSITVGGALIGRIGTNRPFAVGRWLEMTASDAGDLNLAMNDNNYGDNQGFITVEIVVEPAE